MNHNSSVVMSVLRNCEPIPALVHKLTRHRFFCCQSPQITSSWHASNVWTGSESTAWEAVVKPAQLQLMNNELLQFQRSVFSINTFHMICSWNCSKIDRFHFVLVQNPSLLLLTGLPMMHCDRAYYWQTTSSAIRWQLTVEGDTPLLQEQVNLQFKYI